LALCAAFLRSSSPASVEFWCVIGLCAGIFSFVQGFRLLQRRHLILDTPFSKIRSASMGMVELSGLAIGPYTMVAPISARPCYYYRTLVWEWKRQGKSNEWVKVAAECMHLPFFLDDNTGRVLVDPRGADLDIHCDFLEEFSDALFTTKDPPPGNVRAFLARHGVDTNNKIKVEEYCIKPKNSLFILGSLADNPGIEVMPQPTREEESLLSTPRSALLSLAGASISFASSSLSFANGREENLDTMLPAEPHRTDAGARTSQVIRLSPKNGPAKSTDMTQQQKIAAALVKAGISNPAAWAAAGLGEPTVRVNSDPAFASRNTSAAALNPPVDGDGNTNGGVLGPATPLTPTFTQDTAQNLVAANSDTFDRRPPIVLMKGTNNPAFMISWRSQQAVAGRLAWKSILMIWGGPALALACLYALFNLLHLR
jgi:hypothetical protein